MKKLIKILGFTALVAGIVGNTQLNAILDKEARYVADWFFAENCNDNFLFLRDQQTILTQLSMAKSASVLGGSIAAFTALLFACNTVKRFVKDNVTENRAWKAVKTAFSFTSTVGFSLASLAAAFLYKAATMSQQDYASLANYDKTLVRLLINDWVSRM